MQNKNTSKLLRQTSDNYQYIEHMLNGYAINEIILDYKHEPVDYRFIEVNSAFEEITGLKRKNVVGKNVLTLLPQTKKEWITLCGDIALNEKDICTEYYSPTLDKYFHVRIKSVEKGKFITVFNDVTSFVEANKEIKRQKEEYESIFKNINVGLIRTNVSDGKIINANPVCAKIFGFETLKDFLQMNVFDLYKDQNDRKQHRAKLLRNSKVKRSVLEMKKANGKSITVLVSSNLHYKNNLPIWADSTVQDISKQQQSEEKLYQLAHFDALTKLSNRYAFMDKLKEVLQKSSRHKQKCAVFFLDLDGFKMINDTYGHNGGDDVLLTVAQRLKSIVRKSDTVARIGGDEFTIIIENFADVRSLNLLAKKIIDNVSKDIKINNNVVNVTTSLGVSIYPDDADTLDEMLTHADKAMYRAKELGKNTLQFFTKDLNIDLINKMLFESELNKSIQEDELQLFYKAIVDINTDKIISIQSILRWHSKSYGWVAPEDFIPVAMQSDLITKIISWAIENSCTQMMEYKKEYKDDLGLCFSVPNKCLDSKYFFSIIKKSLSKSKLKSSCLELQIQQNALKEAKYVKLIKDLQNLGVKIIIENFGVGVSSIFDLQNVDITSVRLDEFLVKDLNNKNPSKALKACVSIAKTFEFNVIATNVKSEFELLVLKDLGIKFMQGPYLHKAISSQDMKLLLRNTML